MSPRSVPRASCVRCPYSIIQRADPSAGGGVLVGVFQTPTLPITPETIKAPSRLLSTICRYDLCQLHYRLTMVHLARVGLTISNLPLAFYQRQPGLRFSDHCTVFELAFGHLPFVMAIILVRMVSRKKLHNILSGRFRQETASAVCYILDISVPANCCYACNTLNDPLP
jgi:hypothetical protein